MKYYSMGNLILDFEKWSITEGKKKKKKGLWDNVHAKRKRGESPAKKGDSDYPEEDAWKDATNEELNESTGIPDRYKTKGFTKVGVKKRAPSGKSHKWEVLARKKVGGKMKYKIVKGGHRGMKDYSQHKDNKRKKSFWDRMGGKNSSKAKDPFSALYWHKRFGTW